MFRTGSSVSFSVSFTLINKADCWPTVRRNLVLLDIPYDISRKAIYSIFIIDLVHSGLCSLPTLIFNFFKHKSTFIFYICS